ncbi:MAG: PAS domain-containing protein, partial [Flavisolibacter sp.]
MNTNLNLLLQSINEAIVVLDTDGYIVYSNPAVTAATGFTISDLLNQHLAIFYPHSDDLVKAEYEIGLALKKGRLVSEGWRSKKGQEQFWAEASLAPFYDEQKKLAGHTYILRDISEKKQ